MTYYDRIHISEGIGVNKTSKSKECDICNYWYISKKGFKFSTYVWNRCHDLLTMPMNHSNIAILNIKSADYHCIIIEISKSEVRNVLQNVGLTEKRGTLQNMQIYYHT